MTTLLDTIIGILIILISVLPFLLVRKNTKYILIPATLLCISLYVFQAYTKYRDFGEMKKEKEQFYEDLNKQQQEIMHTQRIVIEKQTTFLSLLNNLQEAEKISADTAIKLKNIYGETVSLSGNTASRLEETSIDMVNAAGSVKISETIIYYDREHKLLWAIPKAETQTWEVATASANKFNAVGYTNWRLPSISEITIIISDIIKYREERPSAQGLLERFKKMGFYAYSPSKPFLALEWSYYWTTENQSNNFANVFNPYTGDTDRASKNETNLALFVKAL